ncbi:hypothetical protein FA048_11675 [Pedobacter polaris]|uniref:Uncharacterized protein n=1 Tax=Pedobacter polaris TaxID=2571273 RepID=A0A4V5P1L1_9SPHI|nr:hypothetical protein [Pedobacter polaris]TKC10822.1 hypothetical protein FA048_11675 [Pedobacter polaris]
MKKIILTIIYLICLMNLAYAQKISDNQISLDFQKLANLKVDFEKYRNNTIKKDSVLILYKDHINKIKKSPEIYLYYIKNSLKTDELKLTKERLQYKYPLTDVNDLSQYLIKWIDFFRVIKYSLFKKNDDLLPIDFRGLPVVDENNYKPKYGPKPSGHKLALRYLLDSVGFNSKEKKMLKKAENPDVVMQIKEYLDEKGLSLENKGFVKWALKQLILPNNNINLFMLDAIYEPNRNKNYVPRDREPTNQH